MVFNRQTRSLTIGWLASIGYFSFLSGCLNPAFINGLSGGSVVPLAPGDTPYVQVLLINATSSKTVAARFGFTPEYQQLNAFYMYGIEPQGQRGFLLGCPVNQVGLGDPTDLTLPALVLTTTDGTVNVPPSAFPLTLQSGNDYVCGDTVVFTIVDDASNGYGVNVSTGRVDGSAQGGPFSGPDTYAIYQLLQYSGTVVTPIP
jgi:hypothetical protein